MAKKPQVELDSDATEAPLVVEEQSAAIEPVETAPPTPAAPAAPYILGQWNGMPMWRCPVCLFDTLDGEGTILDHMRAHAHTAPPAAPQSEQKRDRFGNPW